MVAVCLMPFATCMAQEENLSGSTLQEKTSQLQTVPNLKVPEILENPRGVYKLIGLLDKYDTFIKEPFDQYKICTDSVTLMMSFTGNRFRLTRTDSSIFDYTGEAPDPQDSTATRIYDCNRERFTLKWWSTTPGHLYFPNKGWCTEYYEAGKYSEASRIVFEALMSPCQSDKSNPFIGAWRVVGMMDEMRNVKKELERLHEEDGKRNAAYKGYHILTPTHFINTTATGGTVHTVTYHGKKQLTIGPTAYKITWLTKNRVAIEIHEGFRTDYEIWERILDPRPVFDQLASVYVN